LYRRLAGPQGQSGWVRKILHPPGFELQTAHPIASCYTDYAILPTVWNVLLVNITGGYAKMKK
jgi:hypothetical protein